MVENNRRDSEWSKFVQGVEIENSSRVCSRWWGQRGVAYGSEKLKAMTNSRRADNWNK